MLKPITSLEDIEVGQLVNDGKKTKKVLAKSGLLVWLSLAENHDEVCAGYTINRIVEKGMQAERPEWKYGDKYFYITSSGDVIEESWTNDSLDLARRRFLGTFRTRKMAEERVKSIL